MPKLTLTGTVIQADPETRISGLLTVTKLGSHALGTERDASATAITVDAPDDSIVKIEYENGLTEWLRADQFASEIGQNRDATGAVIVPRVIDRGETTRGPVGWVLKTLHLFGVSPTDVLARESAAEIVQHFDAKLNLGLFRLSKEGNFQSQITTSDQLDNQKPYLVFIHGTASSTAGSFSGFWSGDNNQPTAEWTQMLAKYPDRILALEHATFSVSPAQNALDLVNLLPHGAAVHLISHSRGGLVGELLGLDPSQIADLGAFKGRNDEKLIGDLLNGLRDKKITVQKFVRVACPASGTILAAKRMDIYLNVLLNAIGLIPGINVSPAYDVFKATALELIKLRADPATIPGIEAMMPESPFIHFLNTKGRTSKADLGVIAGNYEGAGVWGTLKSYALRAYYWEDNDIVVNTRSMTGGTERTSGVWEYFEEGDTVNHFHYFKNLSTRGRVLQWLSSDAPPSGYEHVRGVVAPQSRGEGDQAGVVFVLPDVFASEIKDEQQSIWLNFDALAAGALLSLKNDNLKAGDLLTTYKGLVEKLASVYNVRPFGYDWRKSVKDSAALLAQEVRNQNKGPIHFIGHGMGGLVLLEFLASNQDDWQKLRANGSKIVLLGAPTRGSWQIAKLLRGHASLVKMLALLGRHSDAEIVELVQGFQGLLDLLPDSMLDSQAWQSSPFTRPDPVRLAATRDWREKLRGAVFPTERMVYVAGSAPSTPSALDQYTVSGDGHVTYEMGLMPRVQTWYDMERQHGDLPNAYDSLLEILSKGTAKELLSEPRLKTSALNAAHLLQLEESVFFPSERDLLNAALGCERGVRKTKDLVLRVRVTHGHLREARHPVAVGHYVGDAIVSAEAQLDRRLGGRLSNRFHMETYAGPLGTVEIVRAPSANPPGALVIGLGQVGELNSETLRKGVLEACLRYALARAEDSDGPAPRPGTKAGSAASSGKPEPRSAAISSLLIGVSAGSYLSIRDSVLAITQAVVEANRTLSHRKVADDSSRALNGPTLTDRVIIDELEFIELYEENAIEAIHAVYDLRESLEPNLEPGERLDLVPNLQWAPGGRFRRPLDIYATGWWRRIQITEANEKQSDPAKKLVSAAGSTQPDTDDSSCSRFVFTALTDRARIEETLTLSQNKISDLLIKESTTRTDFEKCASVALFELLMPNPFKAQARETADLVLMVDEAAAHFPWELMTDRLVKNKKPLAVEAGMIRQFKTSNFEVVAGPRRARLHNALVIGDTISGLVDLPGAQREAANVAHLLQAAGYNAEPALIKQSARDVVCKLFADDYRILHIAGHGMFTPDRPERTGLVLEDGIFLSPLEFKQIRVLPELVFINCCHLGQFDDGRRLNTSYPEALAGSVAETLIQRGVKAVVAAGWAVDDTAAVKFAITFYQHLLNGGKFGEAVKRAREAAYSPTSNTWGAYQCYGNPDFALSLRPLGGTSSSVTFRSRSENIDELRDIVADALDNNIDEQKAALFNRVAELDKTLPAAWRDGEVLCLLGEAYRHLGRLNEACTALRDAIERPEATARLDAVEHLANCLDRLAKKLYDTDPAGAKQLWDNAEQFLTGLNAAIGESHERLSLLGGLWKRRGEALAGPEMAQQRTQAFQKSRDYYRDAYKRLKEQNNEISPYSGVNWLAMAHVSEGPLDPNWKTVARECLDAAQLLKDQPLFWDRTALPDTLLVKYLNEGTLHDHVDELAQVYNSVFTFGTPIQIDSVLSQIQFIQKMRPNDDLANLISKLTT